MKVGEGRQTKVGFVENERFQIRHGMGHRKKRRKRANKWGMAKHRTQKVR